MPTKLPDDFPHDELERRLAADAKLRDCVAAITRAETAYNIKMESFAAEMERRKADFQTQFNVIRLVANREAAIQRAQERRNQITSKLKREYWLAKKHSNKSPEQIAHLAKMREAWKANAKKAREQQTRTRNEAPQGQNDGNLQSADLDGTRLPDNDNAVR